VSADTTQPTGKKAIAGLLGLALVSIVIGAIYLIRDDGKGPPPSPQRPTRGAESRPRPAPKPTFFASTSFWNAPLADDAPLDPQSPRLVGAFAAEIERERAAGTGPWIQTDESSTPVYVVPRDQPLKPLRLDTGPWGDSLRRALAPGVPIPADARPAGGRDAHMTIYQPSTDRLWEFWHAGKQEDGWHAEWGGVMGKVSRSPGYYTDRAYPGARPDWGSTATSLPIVGGTILISELRSGAIPHALALDVPYPRQGVFAWPAQRSDGRGGPETLPEGARLRVDPRLDLSHIEMHPVARMLAEAAQRYGIVVRDGTHHATAFYAEDPAPTGSDPYRGAGGFFGGEYPSEVLEDFPWDHLQVLSMRLCHRATCTRAGAP
jgi:hypothetical protein